MADASDRDPALDETLRVPEIRIRCANDAPLRARGSHVLYWMIAARRTRYNFGLQRAVELARQRQVPLLVLEALRVDYRWASDRHHAFLIEGMRDNAAAFARAPVTYYPYVEPRPGAGRGLLAALAARAVAVVTDEFPSFFLPHMVSAAARTVDARVEVIDGNGLYPLFATERVFTTAASFRRHLQRELPEHLACRPRPNPLARVALPTAVALPAKVERRWPRAALGGDLRAALAALPIDHAVAPVGRGGARAAGRRLAAFLAEGLPRYAEDRNRPEVDATSRLSPYLHAGHISAHEVFEALMRREQWGPDRLAERPTGSRTGWWGASEAAEALLDQLVTWRELGFNAAAHQPGFDRYESLPAWALGTLAAHARDPRPHVYDRDALERAATHDPLWNATQRQLVRDGAIHGYLRMLWGKKILEWSRHPRDALATMIELNDKYALDGRDPNSYSGIFWVLGRYDRAWGPERPIFGKVRYMSSTNTARKVRVGGYLARYGAG